MTAVVTFRYPTTNNQLRNSSNHRQQATVNDGRVTLQPISGRHTSFAAGTTRTYTPGASGSNFGKQRTNMSFDEFDKETVSSDGLQPKQAYLSCVHALNEPHLHEIHVVPSKHEADQH
ncbi:hypothetical protein Tco_0865032 [Tanacetum coccineum]